jgi:hypothetical protein
MRLQPRLRLEALQHAAAMGKVRPKPTTILKVQT